MLKIAGDHRDLSAWKPHEAAMLACHRGDPDAVLVVYDDYGRDEVPVSYFFRGPDQFASYERARTRASTSPPSRCYLVW